MLSPRLAARKRSAAIRGKQLQHVPLFCDVRLTAAAVGGLFGARLSLFYASIRRSRAKPLGFPSEASRSHMNFVQVKFKSHHLQ